MADDNPERGFKVVDRRSFDQDGEERVLEEGSPPVEEEQTTGSEPEQGSVAEEPSADGADSFSQEDDLLPEIDFVTFVLSLHSSAACLLGKVPYPDTGKCEVNLPMAKQTIDILSMLQEKTKGNLSGEEERIMSEMLYDLRMVYVQAVQK